MDDLINMYCKNVIYTLEKKIYELEKKRLNTKELSRIEIEYLKKYDDLLMQKYIHLEEIRKYEEKA